MTLMSQEAMLNFTATDLQITAHVYLSSPKSVKKLSFLHMVYDFLLLSQQTYEHLGQPETHYVFVPSKASLKLHRKIYQEQKLKNNLILIPGGYPRHDENIRQYQKVAETFSKCDSVLYAPTLCTLTAANESADCYSIIEAVEFLPALLNTFKNITLIFRPHPEDVALVNIPSDHPRAVAFKQVFDFCYNHPRCITDVDKQNYLNSFARSQVIISDTSSVAFSFVLLTNRPAIFFSNDHNQLIKDFKECQFINDRNKFGVLASTIPELITQIAFALNEKTENLYNAEFCRQVIFNLGSSEEYLLSNFEYILNDKRHPDWVYLQDDLKEQT